MIRWGGVWGWQSCGKGIKGTDGKPYVALKVRYMRDGRETHTYRSPFHRHRGFWGVSIIHICMCVYRERPPTRRRSRFAFDGGEKLNLLYSYIGIGYGKNNKTVVGFFSIGITIGRLLILVPSSFYRFYYIYMYTYYIM